MQKKDEKKVYEVALAVTAEKYLKVAAATPEEAVREAARIYVEEIPVRLDKTDIDYVFINTSERHDDNSKITVKTSLSAQDGFDVNRIKTIVRKALNIEECDFNCESCRFDGYCPESLCD